MSISAAWVHNFADTPPARGIFMRRSAEALREAGVDVDLICMGPLRGGLGFPGAIKILRDRVKGYDLIHAQYGSGCAYVASRLPGPRVVTLRGSDWYGNSGTMGDRARGIVARRLTLGSLSSFARVLVVAERMRREVVSRVSDPETVCVYPSGIDLATFTPMNRHAARERLGHGDDKTPWVLFSSVLEGNRTKRPELAQAAMERVQAALPGSKLKLLTGVPPDEVPLHVNAANAVLLTSTHEGWPNIIKEALACDVPFVSTDVSDLQAIADEVPTCAVCPPDPAALAASLIRTLQTSRPSGLASHIAFMDRRVQAEQLRSMYETVVRDHRG